jgi:hypothetical protein
MSGEVIPFYGWGLVVLGIAGLICVVAFILCLKYAHKLNEFFERILNKLSIKK